jgi:hypothetical protein
MTASTALLALVAGASATWVPGVASAPPADVIVQPVPPAQPYGGQLGLANDTVGADDPIGVALLGFGALNALGLAAGCAVDALRGPSPEQSRRALMARSGPGTVS